MGTPHNEAEPGELARTVLMPGDPLRAEFLAKNWLDNARMVNRVRNCYGFTGLYKGKEVSVMASGMGMPSIGIYSYELFKEYGVDNIIRIGSSGAYSERLKLYDVVLADASWSESAYARVQSGDLSEIQYPSKELNQAIMAAGMRLGIGVVPAIVHSSDAFYREPGQKGYREILKEHHCECVEMESFALFHNAALLGKKAACLLTISDSFVTGEESSAKERQEAFSEMIEVALETVNGGITE